MDDISNRLRRLEDRQAIVDVVVRYCVAVDSRDWDLYAECFAATVRTDSGELSGTEFVEMVKGALPAFRSTQHLSTNHLVIFDESEPDVAICASDMFAQHFLEDSPGGSYYLLRARYREELLRTPEGWRISAISTTNRWEDGNLNAVTEAFERIRSATTAV
ncbi:nuclear transport factor 2 family protein [Leifsonia shinshuensis]|uniref:nuclear transport factor 2 family protein n=1 Tax=Leifsonia shinshuensis TaxID=150026 RepID=UPI00285E6796|nr:nuclear transport factor 2 family protein [Leifsonia shinshuensis]MDR6972904.1 hypothetical protein [Leifsonia shinshuensis]